MLRASIFFCLFILSFSLLSQNYTLSGTLLDESTGDPVANATIKVKNSDVGTVTGPKGGYSIELAEGSYELIISSVGFATFTQSVVVSGDQELELKIEEGMYSLPEFVVETNTLTAGRLGMKEIPGSVQYLDARKLQEQRYSNVNDVLKQIPGVNIQEEDGFGLRPNIGLRGSGLERSSKITLMEDGILAAPAPYAAPSAYYFPTMGRMSGIEVMKGSSQVRFGPFTTGGAINFLSTPIPSSQSAFISLGAGSFGYQNIHTYVGNKFDRVGYLVELFQYGSDGFKTVPNGESGFLKNDVNVKLSVNTNPDKSIYQSLTFNVGRTNEDSDETYLGLTQEDFNQDPFRRYAASQLDNMDAQQERYSIQHYIEIPKLFNVVTTAYRNDFHRNWYKLQSAGGASLSAILEDPTTYGAQYDLLTGATNTATGDLVVRANNRTYYSQGIQTTFDIEFETGRFAHDIHVSTRIHRDQEDRFQHQDAYGIENGVMELVTSGAPGSNANRIEQADAVSSYLFYKLNVGKFSFTPGIRNENVTIAREDYGTADPDRVGDNLVIRSNKFDAWLPGMGVHYAINPNSSLFGGVHKGFAPGSSQEGSRPESSINYELGARRTTKALSATAVFFLNDYQNLLGADNASAGGTGSGALFNAGEALTKGLEFQMSYDLLSSSKSLSFPLTIAYTYTDAQFESSFDSEFEGWGTVTKGDDVPYLAKNQWFINASLQTAKMSVSVNGKYQSAVRTVPGSGDAVGQNQIAAFFTSDASINYFLDGRTTLFGSVTNIGDAQYAVSRRPAGLRPGMPRAFRLGISMNF